MWDHTGTFVAATFDLDDDKADVIILYDSMYAADVIQGIKKANYKKNQEVIQLAQAQLKQVRE